MIQKGFKIPVGNHGYVRYVDHYGSDSRIVEAARVSYDSPSKGGEQDKKLLHYLYKNRHTSPFEQCSITFEIRMPIFVMRQFVRHRTFRLNEVSARYTELPDDFFIPKEWRLQDTKNKQGSVTPENIDKDWHDINNMITAYAYATAWNVYKKLIARGVCREQARIVLPVGIYTKIYVNCDLHNLMHFLRLRLDSHAQAEIREFAQAMFDILKELFPWTAEAFVKYKFEVIETE